jgi:hypothetical protein
VYPTTDREQQPDANTPCATATASGGADRQPAVGRSARGGFSTRGLLITLLPNVILPWMIYQILTSWGVTTINALMATAVVPLATTLYQWLHDRRVDAVGNMTLAFVAVGLVTTLISDDPFFYLVKESLLTGAWGLVMLAFLLAKRPLTFHFGRQFMSGGDPERAAFFDALWQKPRFRQLQRWICVLWGIGLVGEAALRVLLVYVLPISVFLIVSPAMGIAATALLMVMTMLIARRGQPPRPS